MLTKIIYVLIFLMGNQISLNLCTDHICQKEERYMVNVTQYFIRNATIRSYQWCLQVPPRCSTFTVKSINESRIVEEEQSRIINVCCDGYQFNDEGSKCLPICDGCQNGVCTNDRKCYCHPGWRGDSCERVCEPSRWGRYCRYHCECLNGKCNPETGQCNCSPGWIGNRCELQCRSGYFGEQCKGQCNCGNNEYCNHVDGQCSVQNVTLSNYFSVNQNILDVRTLNGEIGKIKENENKKIIGLYLLTTENVAEMDLTTLESTTDFIETTAEDVTIDLNVSSTSEYSSKDNGETTTPVNEETTVSPIVDPPYVNIKSTNRSDVVEKPNTMKGKVVSEVSGTRITVPSEKTRFNDDSHLEVIQRDSLLGRGLVISLTGAIIAAIIFILCIGFYLNRLAKRKSRESIKNKEEKNAFPSNIHMKSIFHTPLPEPPGITIDETSSTSTSPKILQIAQKDPEDTLIVSSTKNTTLKEYLELFYDHPSSTGSYRTAGVLEPPPNPSIEPVYDEIPCWQLQQQELLYSNMHYEDKTKF